LKGYRVGLRNGLPASYREGIVLVGKTDKTIVHKGMARNLPDCLQYTFVGNAFGPEFVHKHLPEGFVYMSIGCLHNGFVILFCAKLVWFDAIDFGIRK
jgi:hypothetical protein